jgi:hypothetical protein
MYQGLNCMDPVNSTVWQFLTDDFWNCFISSSIDVIWIWLLFILIWFCAVSKWWWDLVNSLLSSKVWINQIATFYKQKTEIHVATDITMKKTIPPITLLWSTVWLNQIATFYKQKAEICVATDITIQNKINSEVCRAPESPWVVPWILSFPFHLLYWMLWLITQCEQPRPTTQTCFQDFLAPSVSAGQHPFICCLLSHCGFIARFWWVAVPNACPNMSLLSGQKVCVPGDVPGDIPW